MAGLLLALVAGAWVIVVLSAPLAPAQVAAVIYGFGAQICHQIPERSLHLGAFQLPVCARCLGIYGGAALGAAAPLLLGGHWRARAPSRAAAVRRLVGVAVLPTIATVLLEWVGLWFPSNAQRLMAGVPLGCAIAFVVARELATVNYTQCAPSRPIVRGPPGPT